MHTLVIDSATTATYIDGQIVVHMEGGLEIKFPVKGDKRLARGTTEQLNKIEMDPF